MPLIITTPSASDLLPGTKVPTQTILSDDINRLTNAENHDRQVGDTRLSLMPKLNKGIHEPSYGWSKGVQVLPDKTVGTHSYSMSFPFDVYPGEDTVKVLMNVRRKSWSDASSNPYMNNLTITIGDPTNPAVTTTIAELIPLPTAPTPPQQNWPPGTTADLRSATLTIPTSYVDSDSVCGLLLNISLQITITIAQPDLTFSLPVSATAWYGIEWLRIWSYKA